MTAIFLRATSYWNSFTDVFRPIEMPSVCSYRKFQVILQHTSLAVSVLSVIAAIFAAFAQSPYYFALCVVTFSLSVLASYKLREVLLVPPPPPPPLLSPAVEKRVTESLVHKHRHESPQADHELFSRIQDHVKLKLLPSSLSPEKRKELLKDYKKDRSILTSEQIAALESDLKQQEEDAKVDEVKLNHLLGPSCLSEVEDEVAVPKSKRSHLEEAKLFYKHDHPLLDRSLIQEVEEQLKGLSKEVVPSAPFTAGEIKELEDDLEKQATQSEQDTLLLNTLLS